MRRVSQAGNIISRAKKNTARTTITSPENHGCYVTSMGTLHVFQVPSYIESRIIEGKPIPSSFLYGLRLRQYILAPDYQDYLARYYGKEKADKIILKLNHFLELARIYKSPKALEKTPDNNDFNLDIGD